MSTRNADGKESGPLAEFVALVESHSGPLFRYLLRMVGDRPLAEDLLQDTFAAAYAHRDHCREAGSARGWLFTVARNRAYNALRDESRTLTSGDAVARQLAELPATSPAPDAEVLRLELRAEILSALQQLSPARREAVTLRDIEGLSYADIAAITGSTEATARVRVHRARQQLQHLLTPYLRDELGPPDAARELEDAG
jgi:RNA polymerase sigma-70 factor (ECF subfamily)